jgi:LmbE family N-acetylglucosaminyl deacetylase
MIVLAVGCHPDDLEIACGGTLRKYVEQGAEVHMCHVANGCQGHVVIEPEPLRLIRTREAEMAGQVIGAKQVINLDVPDMEVNAHDFAIMDAMADVVRSVRPDVIITHNHEDYMYDHCQTSIIATNGSFCSGLSHRPRAHEPFSSFVPVFFMDTLAGVNFQPTHYVDITNQIETKIKALECHESQLKWMLEHDGIDFADMVRTCSKYRGYQCGAAYAEGFRPYNVYPRYSTKNLLPD